MSLRPGETPGHGIAVFPFLKTHQSIRLGSLTFRTTDDVTGLEEQDAVHVREIRDMLFLQDDLRIRSASYAVLPALDLEKDESILQELEHVQAIVAYCYSAPHSTLGTPFFCFEHVSLAVFSPEPVLTFLVRPENHADAITSGPELTADQWHRVSGYQGRYNFRHPFWVVKGSRLYPPVPHIGLNNSQDLATDLGQCFSEASQHSLLPELLGQPTTETAARVLTSIAWYNRSNTLNNDDDNAIINLAIAFETLLGLPKDAKTDRFVDAVSLLLGRVSRLGLWAEQFYDARSDVAHQGKTERLRFAPTNQKNAAGNALYHSLLAYGRQIFQLCVGTLLFGAALGTRAGLREKLITNQERFELICKTFDDNTLTMAGRFAAVDETLSLIEKFRFVMETGLRVETMIGAAQSAAKGLLQTKEDLDPVFKQQVEELAGARRSSDPYQALAAIKAVHDLKSGGQETDLGQAVTRRLVEAIWHYTGMHYFWLEQQRTKGKSSR